MLMSRSRSSTGKLTSVLSGDAAELHDNSRRSARPAPWHRGGARATGTRGREERTDCAERRQQAAAEKPGGQDPGNSVDV